jgi:hypothetical protein
VLSTRRAADVALRIKEDIASMEQLTREQIKELVSEYVRDSLESIRDYVVHRRPLTPDSFVENLEGLSGYLSSLQEDLALNQLDSVQGQVDGILEKHKLRASAELRQELAHSILSAGVSITATQLEAMRTGRVDVHGVPKASFETVRSPTLHWRKRR